MIRQSWICTRDGVELNAVHDDKTVRVFVGEGDGDGLTCFEVEFGKGAEEVAGLRGYGLIKQEARFFAVGLDCYWDIGGAGFVG